MQEALHSSQRENQQVSLDHMKVNGISSCNSKMCTFWVMTCLRRRTIFKGGKRAAAFFLLFTFLCISTYFQVQRLSGRQAEGRYTRNLAVVNVRRDEKVERGREGVKLERDQGDGANGDEQKKKTEKLEGREQFERTKGEIKKSKELDYVERNGVLDDSDEYRDLTENGDDGGDMKIEFAETQKGILNEPQGKNQRERNYSLDVVGKVLINDNKGRENNNEDDGNREFVNDNVMKETTIEGDGGDGTTFNNLMERELEELRKEQERIDMAVYNDIRPPPPQQKKKFGHFPYNNLLLSSMGRSGSSFLGGLLNKQKSIVYFFEPFHDLGDLNLLTETTVVEGLKGIFTCDIPDPLLSTFQMNPNFFFRDILKHCKNINSCLSRRSLNYRCSRKQIRAVKTIRTRLSWLPPIMDDDSVNMKIIHLVRDPRPAIISGWDRNWNFKAADVCQDLADDLRTGLLFSHLYPEQYMAVLYEDLCDNPWEVTKHIFSYLGYKSLPITVAGYLKRMTSGGDSSDPYSLSRNTRQMKEKWRWDITEKQLKDIEGACGRVITKLGFRLFGTIENVRNASSPLFNSANRYGLFKYDFA